MSVYLYAYKQGSESAKNLANALGIKRIKHENSNFRGEVNKVVINWGSSDTPEEVNKCNVINSPQSVGICSNKLSYFNTASKIKGLNIPEFTEDIEKARQWVNEDQIVVCRTVLQGNSGRGIVIAQEEHELENCRLYVKYVPKKDEYRVHVFNGEVICIQRKALREDAPRHDHTWKIRNHENGFIFARNEDVQVPESVTQQALLAVESMEGLDFGAVDVIYNSHRDKSYVLEINTAPGLQGSTLEDYTNAFHRVLGG